MSDLPGGPDIVDAFENDDVGDTALTEDVAIETGESVDTSIERALAQHAIAADASVQDGHPQWRRAGQHPPRELIGQRLFVFGVDLVPSVIESPNATTAPIASRRDNVDSRQQEPALTRADNRQVHLANVVSGLRDVVGLNAALCIVRGDGVSVAPGKYKSTAKSAIAGTMRSRHRCTQMRARGW